MTQIPSRGERSARLHNGPQQKCIYTTRITMPDELQILHDTKNGFQTDAGQVT
jgi:hypothetical protein